MIAPLFSVVMATHGREAHMAPSIASVLRQSLDDFELIVVSDGPAATNQDWRAGFPDDRISWHELPANSGSQAAPNNHGIGVARGSWIAYLGHDDIWSAAHLQEVAAAIGADDMPDVVISGCFYHGPPGTGIRSVNGYLDASAAGEATRHFLPPSSVAHRRGIMAAVGPWRDPRTIAAPDDADFLLRAAHAGLRFRATGKATVHKFAAGHRYLSYLCQQSDEQEAMLRHARLDHPDSWAGEIDQARADGCFMVTRHPDYSTIPVGTLFAMNRTNKGIERAALRPLDGATTLAQTAEGRALDWYGLQPDEPAHRWSGPNPRPKILLPFCHDGVARIRLQVPPGFAVPPGLEVHASGSWLEVEVADQAHGSCITVQTRLNPSWYTVLQLFTPQMEAIGGNTQMRRGVAISDIVIEPLGRDGRPIARRDATSRIGSTGGGV